MIIVIMGVAGAGKSTVGQLLATDWAARIEPNSLAEEIKKLSGDKEIYLYCT